MIIGDRHQRAQRKTKAGNINLDSTGFQKPAVTQHDVRTFRGIDLVALISTQYDVVAAASIDHIAPAKGRVNRRNAVKGRQILNGFVAPECCAKVTKYQVDSVTKVFGFAKVRCDFIAARPAEDKISAQTGQDNIIAACGW